MNGYIALKREGFMEYRCICQYFNGDHDDDCVEFNSTKDGGFEMTQVKAKMYKTAVIVRDIEDYKAGDVVSVKYLGRASFGGFRFQVSANYLSRPVVCLTDSDLKDFIL